MVTLVILIDDPTEHPSSTPVRPVQFYNGMPFAVFSESAYSRQVSEILHHVWKCMVVPPMYLIDYTVAVGDILKRIRLPIETGYLGSNPLLAAFRTKAFAEPLLPLTAPTAIHSAACQRLVCLPEQSRPYATSPTCVSGCSSPAKASTACICAAASRPRCVPGPLLPPMRSG